MKTLSGLG